MRLIDRAKNLIVSPRTEWEAIEADPAPIAQVVTGYVLPLAGAAALASFIGMSFVGVMGFRMGPGWGLAYALYSLVMAVVFVFVLGFIIDALAPTFGGRKNLLQAQKLAAYAYTPAWLTGLFAIIPMLSFLGLIGALYGLYLLYLGLPRLMKNPPDKSAGYTALVVVSAIVVAVIITMIGSLITAPAMMSAHYGPGAAMTVDKDSPAGQMDEFARKMEEAARRMEAAEKSGDPQKQMEAAMGALGTALSGGKGVVEPVQADALKAFVPERFAGLERVDMRSERSGVAGLMATRVQGEYGEGDKRVELEVVDTGGAAGLTGLAGWASLGATSESENSDRVERMRREGNRLVREEVSKRGGTHTYSVILADRYIVTAEGQGVELDALKSAVGALDLAKLEALK